MKRDNVIHIKVKAAEGSPLEKGIDAYFENRAALRKKRMEQYKKGVEKQIKKLNEAGYKFINTAPNEYEFYTAFGAGYRVSFDATFYFAINHPAKDFIFSVDILLLYPGFYNYYDYVIGITIAEIFYTFFESDKRNIIFYICDPSDGKMAARVRKFDFWLRTYGNENFKKLFFEIDFKGVIVNANFLFEKNNVFAYDLPIIIDEAKDNLSK